MRSRIDLRFVYWIVAAVPLCFVLVFVYSYSAPFPVSDQWDWSLSVAVSGKNGEVDPGTLFDVTAGGHRTLFTHLHTIVFARILNWRTDIEAFVNPAVALVNFFLLLTLFQTYRPRLARFAIIPISLMTFSLFQHLNWSMSWQSAWHFTNMFLLGSLLLIARNPPGWSSLLGAALIALCATFSRGHGFLVWPSLAIALWMRGYRWRMQLAWGLMAIAAFAMYFNRSRIRVGFTQENWSAVDVGNPFHLVHSTLAQLGAPMAMESYALAVTIALCAGVFWILNSLYLYHDGETRSRWHSQFVWPALAVFAISTAALISAARREVFPILALHGGYSTTTNLMWLGLAALAIATTSASLGRTGAVRRHRVLGYANLTFFFILLLLYMQTNLQVLEEWERYFGNPLGHHDSPHIAAVTECITRYPLTGDATCLCKDVSYWMTPGMVRLYRLASCGFSPFSNLEPEPILPDSYRPGSPILVNAPLDGVNVYVRKWMLPEELEDVTFNIAGNRVIGRSGCVDPSMRYIWNHPSDELFEQILPLGSAAGAIWYIAAPDSRWNERVFEVMDDAGYLPVEWPLDQPRYLGTRFRLFQFSQVDGAPGQPSPDQNPV